MIIRETACGGLVIEKAIKNCWSNQRSLHAWWGSEHNCKGLPKPVSPLEIKLDQANSYETAKRYLDEFSHKIFVEGFNERVRPDPYEACKAAVIEREKSGNTYLYYVLLGLVRSSGAYGVRYCQCCKWRLIAPNGKKLCPICSVKQNDPASRTNYRRQLSIATTLEGHPTLKAFLDVRIRGERYLLERAVGQAPPPFTELPTGDRDITPDAEYRRLKLEVAEIWKNCNPNARIRERADTDGTLLQMASSGLSRAQAAKAIGKTRAAVTKACARNPALKAMFDRHLKPTQSAQIDQDAS